LPSARPLLNNPITFHDNKDLEQGVFDRFVVLLEGEPFDEII